MKLPRGGLLACCFAAAVLSACAAPACAAGPSPPPGFTPDPHPAVARGVAAPRPLSPGQAMVRPLFRLYQHGAGPAKGRRCPMVPSCSEYARLSVESRGLLVGVLMASDRLHRCGHDLRYYEPVAVDGRDLSYDPPGPPR